MSNSANMSIEELLVQKIKTEALASLVTDEDALTKLVERAVNEALFSKQVVRINSYSTEERDSPVVAASREVAKRLVDAAVEKLLEDKELVSIVASAVVTYLPQAITDRAKETMNQILGQARENSALQLLDFAQRIKVAI